MKNIFREDKAVIKRLLGYQFVSAVMGILLSGAAAQVRWLNLMTSVLTGFFYCYFIYNAVWEAAAKDRIKYDGNRMAKDMTRGLKFALAANIPNFIIALCVFVGALVGVLTEAGWAVELTRYSIVVARFWEAMYTGFIVYVTPEAAQLTDLTTVLCSLLYLAIIVPAFAVSHFAYWMGFNNKHILKPSSKKN